MRRTGARPSAATSSTTQGQIPTSAEQSDIPRPRMLPAVPRACRPTGRSGTAIGMKGQQRSFERAFPQVSPHSSGDRASVS